ncbi:DUF3558 domain-containing protein [Saccharopolyspora sp. NPDC050389]|uniref:DUF3558 domain-containing protein n=1 Tax=Saccharopolyspora sp. NPDC050389 TaxID=3155516 RepID=UPI0033ECA20B
MRQLEWEESIVRKGLAVGAVLISVLVAGCGGGAETPEPPAETNSSSEPTATQSARTAPVKSLDVSDQCSLVAETRAKSFGADQAAEPGESNGKKGCDYMKGVSGGGFIVFVSADKSQTMQKFADARKSKTQMIEVGGYPAAQVPVDQASCLLALDVSDQGSLYINTLVPSGSPNPCDLSKQFAEAALQNLPDA